MTETTKNKIARPFGFLVGLGVVFEGAVQLTGSIKNFFDLFVHFSWIASLTVLVAIFVSIIFSELFSRFSARFSGPLIDQLALGMNIGALSAKDHQPPIELKALRNNTIVMLGDSRVGKTSLISRYMGKDFLAEYEKTESSVLSTIKKSEGRTLGIYDTPGTPDDTQVTHLTSNPATTYIIVYDLSSGSSFETAKTWVERLSLLQPNPAMILVGNKCDLTQDGLDGSGRTLAKSHRIEFMETNAKDLATVKKLFEKFLEAPELEEDLPELEEREENRDMILSPVE